MIARQNPEQKGGQVYLNPSEQLYTIGSGDNAYEKENQGIDGGR